MVAPFGPLFGAVSTEAGLKMWPSADGDEPYPARRVEALLAVAIGIGLKNVPGVVFGVMLGLYAMQLQIV